MSAETSLAWKTRRLFTFLVSIIVGGLLVIAGVEVLRVLALKYFDAVMPDRLGLLLYLIGMSAVGAYTIGRYRKRIASPGGGVEKTRSS